MATVEHCLYCFEALTAHLEDRKPMSLSEVQASWVEYVRSVDDEANDPADPADPAVDKPGSNNSDASGLVASKRLPALRRLAEASSSSASSSSASSASASTLSLSADTPATSVSSSSATSLALGESPLFVTWNTISPRDGHPQLRGCIGTFEPQELGEGLASYALISALQDLRFSPVARHELPALEAAVTLLTDFEDAADAMDWELGTHGLRISFHDCGKRYGATYLPDVAVEQGWTKEETVMSLMRKAGWMGRRERWRDVVLKVVRYQGKKESLEYGEFKRWRDWVERKGK